MMNKRDSSWLRKLPGILFFLIFTSALIELASFLATNAKLLDFNETPSYTSNETPFYAMTRHMGTNWRTEEDPWGAWHEDHATDQHVKDCFDVTYQSNNVGARDIRDYDDSLTNLSIILIGDSFAEGYAVNIEDTFAKQVEQATSRNVLNFGAAGDMGPVQQDIIYRELASSFPHNELIYLFLPFNDFTDNAPQSMQLFGNRYRPYYQKTSDGYAVVYPEQAVQSDPYPGSGQGHGEDKSVYDYIKQFLMNYTYAANAIRTLNNIRRGYHSPESGGYFTEDADLVEGALFYVNRLLSAAEYKKITVIVVPTASEMSLITRGYEYKDKSWYTSLKQLADEHDAKFIDLANNISRNDYERLYLPCDGHWNSAGHMFAAKRFLEVYD